MENWFVVVMGLSTVFLVLALIIGLCCLLSPVCRAGNTAKEPTKSEKAPAAQSTTPAIANRAELSAAIAAAIAEYSGTDASAIRILSIKKI